MTLFYTAGVQRILSQARELANDLGESELTPTHLLWAVVSDETQATKLLADAGVNRESLPQHAAADVVLPKQSADALELPDSRETVLILDRARVIMRRSIDSEVTSLHLLCALAQVESGVSGFLGASGISDSSFVFAEVEGEPWDVELDLGLATEIGRTAPEADASVWRIIDAAWNRLREGLRVVEDYTRFVRDDSELTRELKQVRHNLTAAVEESFDREHLLSSRDTVHDVGTSISTDREQARASLSDVVRANMSRVQESLRTLEEFSKLVSATSSRAFESARYQTYTIEKRMWDKTVERHHCPVPSRTTAADSTRTNRLERLDQATLYLLVTSASCKQPIEQVVRDAIKGGVDVVQLREKDMDDRRLVELGRQVQALTSELGALFIMNDRPDLAVLTNADGVHVGQEELSVADVRKVIGPDRLIGVSTHSIEQARQAIKDGADYIGVGPTFPSGTKSFSDFAGLDYVREVEREIDLPWFAIGGIDLSNVSQVRGAGANRVAVSGAICRAPSASAAAKELLERLRNPPCPV